MTQNLRATDVVREIYKHWTPTPKQRQFLEAQEFEVFFGGSAGPGKSEGLLISALLDIWYPRYNALLFRREATDLTVPDGLIPRSQTLYRMFPDLQLTYNANLRRWTCGLTGATVSFAGLQRIDDKYSFQSAQVQNCLFDELPHFAEEQYLYLFSRVRRPTGEANLRPKVRGAGNPAPNWTRDRFYLTDIVAQAKWFIRVEDHDYELHDAIAKWPERENEFREYAEDRRFIPALYTDNPHTDPQYVNRLNQLPEVEKRRLMFGDWDAEYHDGIYPNWSQENVTAQADYDSSYPVFWSVDDGFRNPRVILFIQERPMFGIPDCLTVFDELYVTEQLAEHSIQDALARGYSFPELVVHDPSATQFAAECNARFGLPTIPADNDVQEGIKTVRRYIQHPSGVRLLFVHPRCINLIRELPAYAEDKNRQPGKGGDRPPKKENDHSVDALRYYCHTLCAWKMHEL